MTDDPMPASFVWTGDDGPDDMQKVPDGPALGNYPAIHDGRVQYTAFRFGEFEIPHSSPDRRATWGEKLARFLNDLAEKVRRIH